MKNKSLTLTVFLNVLALVTFCVLLIGFSWITDVRHKSIQAADELMTIQIANSETELKGTILSLVEYIDYQRTQAEEVLKTDIKERTYEASAIMNTIYNTNKTTHSKTEIKEMIVDALRNIRFNDGRGYYFIDTIEGDVILYPTFSESEGTNQIELKDDLGNFVLKDEINLVQSSREGYIVGYWKKPESKSNQTYKKITYVKAFEPYGWYFGSGEYLDDVESDIKESIISYINALKYGKNNDQYVFVHDEKGVELANGGYPEMIGSNNYELKDIKGTLVIQAQIDLVESDEGGGFLTHFWPGENGQVEIEKLTYVHNVSDWGWVIGTGVAINDINDIVKIKQKEIDADFSGQVFRIASILFVALCLTIVSANILVAFIKKNLKDLIEFIGKAADSLEEIKLDRIAYDDFKEMVHVTNQMTSTINSLLHRDELTGLYNRRFIQQKLNDLKEDKRSDQNSVSLIMIDIDYFKRVNDRYGHLVGDVVLQVVSVLIMTCVREVDFVSRFGGEEFLIVLKNTEAKIAYDIAERIRKTIEIKVIEPLLEPITISAGVATGTLEDINELLSLSDQRLFKAKEQGRNRIIN